MVPLCNAGGDLLRRQRGNADIHGSASFSQDLISATLDEELDAVVPVEQVQFDKLIGTLVCAGFPSTSIHIIGTIHRHDQAWARSRRHAHSGHFHHKYTSRHLPPAGGMRRFLVRRRSPRWETLGPSRSASRHRVQSPYKLSRRQRAGCAHRAQWLPIRHPAGETTVGLQDGRAFKPGRARKPIVKRNHTLVGVPPAYDWIQAMRRCRARGRLSFIPNR
ncbi:hypothetical protein FIBSPDRAFT_347218 [Athelia psychrophila]|uniref:Uncharacterized protein n=1 Tax=Athelia psychrophila TaxID=1759441 RepID=A0A166PWG5_9AGAM|nr:hypothetical protein FIBSPDRAFT_347218 [Fibularhizoctonia sp. CBS 109695]